MDSKKEKKTKVKKIKDIVIDIEKPNIKPYDNYEDIKKNNIINNFSISC